MACTLLPSCLGAEQVVLHDVMPLSAALLEDKTNSYRGKQRKSITHIRGAACENWSACQILNCEPHTSTLCKRMKDFNMSRA